MNLKYLVPPMIGIVGLIAISNWWSFNHPPKNPAAEAPDARRVPVVSKPRADVIPFDTVETWKIPAGGSGRSIIIDRKLANASDLERLGMQIRKASASEPNYFVFVFTDKRAAALRNALSRASKDALALYDANFVATYSKNGRTGFESLDIHPGGTNDPNWKTIKF